MLKGCARMAIGGFLHVNINCTDFDRSKAFYERLGFRTHMDFPDYASPAICRAMGVELTKCRGALMSHESQDGPPYLDLLEWGTGVSPSNQTMRAPGIARIALWTTQFDASIEAMRGIGAKFVAEPQSIEELGGNRLAFVLDPDGAIIEIIEQQPKDKES